MRLLILTQAVDRDDPVLGFFHGWLEKLAPKFDSLTVICLREGTHRLPKNVRVFSLGKGRGGTRPSYIYRFFSLIIRERGRYDRVFVHMNEEYVLLGGFLWRLMRKPVFLWRNHTQGSWRTSLAVALARKVFYTSPQSFTSRFTNSVKMPVGIDTELFADAGHERDGILILGRIDPVKHVLEMVEVAAEVARKVPLRLRIVGSATDHASGYARAVEQGLRSFGGQVDRVGAVTHHEAASHMRQADILLNFTQAGSLDKALLEGVASGALVLTTNAAVADILPADQITTLADAPRSLLSLAGLSDAEKKKRREEGRRLVEARHGLPRLIETLSREIVEG